MRVLGVDLGSRRIGLAISDPGASFAFPLDAIASKGARKDVEALRALIVEREVERVVVGLPLHMDGRAGPEADAARRFAAALGESTGIPVDTLDERWTTKEAEHALQEGGGSKKSRRKARKSGQLDSMAASIILRTWLEREASE
jgi:putative Holliday junction resolvase